MSRAPRTILVAPVAALLFLAALFLPAAANAVGGAAGLSVTVDRARISTQLGREFVFHSTVTNRSSKASSGLIAHLNVLSLRKGTYVDPEDWSGERTRYLGVIPAGRSTLITWTMKAVNDGSFGVYVAVLPRSGEARPPLTAPAIHVAVTKRRTLNSGGILPLALGIPIFLGLVTLGLRLSRRG
jgi:hypothetical protein